MLIDVDSQRWALVAAGMGVGWLLRLHLHVPGCLTWMCLASCRLHVHHVLVYEMQ